jgi:hypothetical protein
LSHIYHRIITGIPAHIAFFSLSLQFSSLWPTGLVSICHTHIISYLFHPRHFSHFPFSVNL